MQNIMVETMVKEYLEEVKNGDFLLDVSFQRGNDKWNIMQKSLLINSIISGFVIPPLYIAECEGKKVLFDGLQRTTAIREFYNNEYALEGVDASINGKKFSELDSESQQKICEYKLCISCVGELSKDELVEVFLCINNGTALTKPQKTRGYLGYDVASWTKKMCEHPLFTKLASFTERQLKDDASLECLLQGIMLIHGCLGDSNGDMYEWKNISRDTVQNYAKEILSNVSEEELAGYAEVIEYLDTADFTENYEKSFIPVLIVLGKYAIKAGVSNEDFNKYITHMRGNRPAGYSSFKGSGNVSKAKTVGRIKVIIEDFNKWFVDVDKPLINLNASNRKKAKKAKAVTEVENKAESKIENTVVGISETRTDAVSDPNGVEEPVLEETVGADATDDISTEPVDMTVEGNATASSEVVAEQPSDGSDGTEEVA